LRVVDRSDADRLKLLDRIADRTEREDAAVFIGGDQVTEDVQRADRFLCGFTGRSAAGRQTIFQRPPGEREMRPQTYTMAEIAVMANRRGEIEEALAAMRWARRAARDVRLRTQASAADLPVDAAAAAEQDTAPAWTVTQTSGGG
jgi:hypothetical protein